MKLGSFIQCKPVAAPLAGQIHQIPGVQSSQSVSLEFSPISHRQPCIGEDRQCYCGCQLPRVGALQSLHVCSPEKSIGQWTSACIINCTKFGSGSANPRLTSSPSQRTLIVPFGFRSGISQDLLLLLIICQSNCCIPFNLFT